jgi:DNA-3-methyladenine glycosylase
MKLLTRSFYERDPAIVAQELLGKFIVRKFKSGTVRVRISETEAYYGRGDPASRAYKRRTKLNWPMWERGGLAFIYMVHGHWLFNITADKKGRPGAVLIRSAEPVDGVEMMMKLRKTTDRYSLTTGPGKLTMTLDITDRFNGMDLTKPGELAVTEGDGKKFNIVSAYRVGVKKDLMRKLRFYIEGSPFVSKRD